MYIVYTFSSLHLKVYCYVWYKYLLGKQQHFLASATYQRGSINHARRNITRRHEVNS